MELGNLIYFNPANIRNNLDELAKPLFNNDVSDDVFIRTNSWGKPIRVFNRSIYFHIWFSAHFSLSDDLTKKTNGFR